jgi:peptidoglycan/LPS O-acetylase OafA/YrhL
LRRWELRPTARPLPRDGAGVLPDDLSTLAFGQFQALRRFPVLDGIRAIAILLVFTAHPAYQHFWPVFHGANGVTIFFVLSGFLITTLALREESRSGWLDLKAFYIRRICRIYPLYTVVLLLYCVLLLLLGFQASRRVRFLEELPYYSLGFPEHGFFLRQVLAPFDGAWSLGIEEKFYLLWPAMLALTVAAAYKRRFILLLVAGALSIAAPFVVPHGIFVAPYIQIIFGCLAALLLNHPQAYERLRWLGAFPALPALAMGWLAFQFIIPGTGLGRALYAPYGAVVCLLLIGLVTTSTSSIRWLWSRPMTTTATLSYALYLIHNFGLNFSERLVPGGHGLPGSLASTAIGLTLAYVCAYGLNRVVERPGMALGRRFARRGAIGEPSHGLSEQPAAQLP